MSLVRTLKYVASRAREEALHDWPRRLQGARHRPGARWGHPRRRDRRARLRREARRAHRGVPLGFLAPSRGARPAPRRRLGTQLRLPPSPPRAAGQAAYHLTSGPRCGILRTCPSQPPVLWNRPARGPKTSHAGIEPLHIREFRGLVTFRQASGVARNISSAVRLRSVRRARPLPRWALPSAAPQRTSVLMGAARGEDNSCSTLRKARPSGSPAVVGAEAARPEPVAPLSAGPASRRACPVMTPVPGPVPLGSPRGAPPLSDPTS